MDARKLLALVKTRSGLLAPITLLAATLALSLRLSASATGRAAYCSSG
jgi:hypothetical protein